MDSQLDCGVHPKGVLKTVKSSQNLRANDQEDPCLTAARMLRGGGRHKTWEMSDDAVTKRAIASLNAPTAPKPEPSKHGKLKEEAQTVYRNKMTDKMNKAVQVKGNGQANGNALSVSGGTDNMTDHVQKVVIRVWRSGCRPNSRSFRRFKAPLLPPIAEV